jgi:hypothetical protein
VRESDHSSPSSAEAKNVPSYTSRLIKHGDKFTSMLIIAGMLQGNPYT